MNLWTVAVLVLSEQLCGSWTVPQEPALLGTSIRVRLTHVAGRAAAVQGTRRGELKSLQ